MKKTLTKLSQASATAAAMFAMATNHVAAQGLIGTRIDPGSLGFFSDFGKFINDVLSFVMVIAALLVFFYLIWGGIDWITSGGDKSGTEKARQKITAAIIGLIILAASYAILTLVLNFLGFTGGLDDLLV